MKFNTLLPAVALSICALTAVPTIASAQGGNVQAARAENARETNALKTRIETVRARITEARHSGKVTGARAARLGRQVAKVQSSMTRLNRSQGFVSAAELASYNRTLGEVDVALDGYGVPRGTGDGLVAGLDGKAVSSLCRKETTAALIGHPAPDDAVLKQATGSQTIRRLKPGMMATKDYRDERLTVHLDDAGKITAASCG
jgi:hypothetical protein